MQPSWVLSPFPISSSRYPRSLPPFPGQLALPGGPGTPTGGRPHSPFPPRGVAGGTREAGEREAAGAARRVRGTGAVRRTDGRGPAALPA